MNEVTKRKYTATGTEKAAQFLMVMGEDRAAEVLKRLSSEEVQKIGLEMTRMNGMNTEDVNYVLNDFLSECEVKGSINIVADEYTKNVLVQALGAEAAESVLERIMLGGNTKGLDSLRWMEPQLIAGIIQNEHPQIQAIVISYLQPEQAKDVLQYLPENIVVELLIRMAEMESVDPKALQELNYSLEKQVEGVVTKQSSAMGGVKNVANIFNTMDRSTEEALMTKLGKANTRVAERIQELMFVFEDLKKIPNKDFQLLLREVATDKLALALKGAEQVLTDKVTKNMSTRAAEIFLDDMSNMGPVKVSDVEAAQKEILAITKKLADAGQIILSEDNAAMIG
ncbi:MAG: flagellar motor switch protein FliG [Pseudomonadota bacterium]